MIDINSMLMLLYAALNHGFAISEIMVLTIA